MNFTYNIISFGPIFNWPQQKNISDTYDADVCFNNKIDKRNLNTNCKLSIG